MLLEISQIIHYLRPDEKILFNAMIKKDLKKLTEQQLTELGKKQLKTNYNETRKIEDEIIV